MQTFELEGKRREHTGRNASSGSRSNGMIPCNLYGDGENIHFEVAASALSHLVYSPNVYKVLLRIDGQESETLMREVQFHPVSDAILHIDFLRLTPGKAVTCKVPVKLEGLAEGVKAGGKLIQRIRQVNIRATPENLIEQVSIDVSSLDEGKSVRIGEIRIENVEILGTKNIPVATVLTSRALKAMAEAAAAAEAAAKATVAAPVTETAAATTAETGKEEKEKEKEKE